MKDSKHLNPAPPFICPKDVEVSYYLHFADEETGNRNLVSQAWSHTLKIRKPMLITAPL